MRKILLLVGLSLIGCKPEVNVELKERAAYIKGYEEGVEELIKALTDIHNQSPIVIESKRKVAASVRLLGELEWGTDAYEDITSQLNKILITSKERKALDELQKRLEIIEKER